MFTDEQAIDDIEPLQESSLLHGELSLAMFAEKLKSQTVCNITRIFYLKKIPKMFKKFPKMFKKFLVCAHRWLSVCLNIG